MEMPEQHSCFELTRPVPKISTADCHFEQRLFLCEISFSFRHLGKFLTRVNLGRLLSTTMPISAYLRRRKLNLSSLQCVRNSGSEVWSLGHWEMRKMAFDVRYRKILAIRKAGCVVTGCLRSWHWHFFRNIFSDRPCWKVSNNFWSCAKRLLRPIPVGGLNCGAPPINSVHCRLVGHRKKGSVTVVLCSKYCFKREMQELDPFWISRIKTERSWKEIRWVRW